MILKNAILQVHLSVVSQFVIKKFDFIKCFEHCITLGSYGTPVWNFIFLKNGRWYTCFLLGQIWYA